MDYAALQATAGRAILNAGQSVTLTKRTPGAYSASAGTVTVTTTTTSCTAAVLNYPAAMIDGTMIQSGDRKVLLSAAGLSVVPDAGDVLVIESADTHIVKVKRLAPAGTVVMYELQVRS